MNMDAAKSLLIRAVELDQSKRYSEALICYEEGIQCLLKTMEGRTEKDLKDIRKKAEMYLERAEDIKRSLKEGTVQKHQIQYLHIEEGATGYSYYTVFKSCLETGNISWVELEDPYIKANHQIHNFVRFCEMLVKYCKPNLKRISLQTGPCEPEQLQHLSDLKRSLAAHSIELALSHSATLHDREVRFSNGWIVKIGRGLDYFQKPKGQFCIGLHDYDLRGCHQTTVEIYHILNTKKFI